MIITIGCSDKQEVSHTISTRVFNYPVLKGKQNNPVLRLQVDGAVEGEIVKAIQVKIGDTKSEDLKNIRVFYSGLDSLFNDTTQFGSSEPTSREVILKGSQKLEKGTNYFWVSYELAENCDLTSKVYADVGFVESDQGKSVPNDSKTPIAQRVGVALRDHMDDEVHTYRIPGLATTNEGTLLAIYDVRYQSKRDLQGDIDIGVSRSTDGGNIWEPMRIALDMGEWGGLPEKFNGVSDANIIVNKDNGTIYIAGLWMHGVINSEGVWQEGLTEDSEEWNHQWRNKGSQPGFGVKQTSQFLITKSTDDGKTWSDPINITKMCKNPQWWLWAPAPGHGITLKDGTLVMPTQGRDANGLPFSNITYSKDDGQTWKTSNPASHNTTECMAVELADGSIMLNMRDNRNRENKSDTNGRAIMVTKDMGETWTEHPTSHGALVEPTCMASIHKHTYVDSDGRSRNILLFSNPNSRHKRIRQTIKVSLDDGETWPEQYWTELDEGQGSGYSCITSIDNDHIGILYEGSQAQMTFQKIRIDELVR